MSADDFDVEMLTLIGRIYNRWERRVFGVALAVPREKGCGGGEAGMNM